MLLSLPSVSYFQLVPYWEKTFGIDLSSPQIGVVDVQDVSKLFHLFQAKRKEKGNIVSGCLQLFFSGVMVSTPDCVFTLKVAETAVIKMCANKVTKWNERGSTGGTFSVSLKLATCGQTHLNMDSTAFCSHASINSPPQWHSNAAC